jgi:hypothetical protein
MNHPALISREFEPMPDGRIKITEQWNWRHPECPFWIQPELLARLRPEHVIVDVKYKPSDTP